MNLNKVNTAIDTLESHLKNHEVSNPKISKATVAWHIDHSLKVINSVVEAVQISEPSTYKNNFSILGKTLFMLGYFPRGKVKAPKYVRPPENILKEDIISQLQVARTNVATITSQDKNAYFIHPIFGNVSTRRIPRFLETHTNHHLKIINDVLK